MVSIIELKGWKGDGEYQIAKNGEDFIIREPRKTKETGAVDWIEHTVPAKNVYGLWDIIERNCDREIVYGYQWLVRHLIERHLWHHQENLAQDVLVQAFNGGRYRRVYYFPYLYYPLKVLESLGMIKHWGRGGVTRLR